MVHSASNIVVKPIQALRPATSDDPKAHGSRDVGTGSGTNSRHGSEDDIFGRPAGLDLPEKGKSSRHNDPQHGAFAAIKGSAAGIGGVIGHSYKGMLLDLPYAVTEGMRNAPKLYGGQVYDPGAVTDWKSGGIAGAKNFTHGMVEGIGGLVMEPIRGAKKEGALGAAKGAGIGLLNLGTKVSSGIVGLVAMPGQGIYQSTRALMKRKTGKSIMEARQVEGQYSVGQMEQQSLRTIVIEAFERVKASRA